MVELALNNILSPMVLFFVLGFLAAWARSDLTIPEAVAKGIALYLMFAIGFKGGASLDQQGLDAKLVASLIAGFVLSALIPIIAFGMLRAISRLSATDAAAVAAHYGSISIVTFVAATSILELRGIGYEGYLVAVAAVMEAPAIVTALFLAQLGARERKPVDRRLIREVLLNGSIVLLTGSFIIGWITGTNGLAQIESFIVSPFKGVLCLFLLDMGLIAGRGIRKSGSLIPLPVLVFAVVMPMIGATLGIAAAAAIGLSPGGSAILATLAASASYIAVPAAMRVALPEANPAIYLTLSLGVTFPFNLVFGISLYVAAARLVVSPGVP